MSGLSPTSKRRGTPMVKNLAMVLGLVVGLSACADPYYGYHGSGSDGYGYHGSGFGGSGYNGFGYNGYGYHGPGYNGYGY